MLSSLMSRSSHFCKRRNWGLPSLTVEDFIMLFLLINEAQPLLLAVHNLRFKASLHAKTMTRTYIIKKTRVIASIV